MIFVTVMDPEKNSVDIIKISKSFLPEDFSEEWVEGFLKYQGYDCENISWMVNTSMCLVSTYSVVKDEENKHVEKPSAKKTPKNWN